MCYASPGPRCTSHVKKELNTLVKKVVDLEDGGASEQEVRKARRAVEHKYHEYDATPGGQTALKKQIAEAEKQGVDGRKIRALKNRLAVGENLRKTQKEAYEREQERKSRFGEIKRQVETRQAEIAAGSPVTIGDMYPRDLTKAMLKEGAYIQGKGGWGGPSYDYQGTAHLKECGVLATTDIDEYHSWGTYDTFEEYSHVGIKATTTCNCGQVLDAPLVGENMQVSRLIASMNKIR